MFGRISIFSWQQGRLLVPGCLFILYLAWFVFATGWYEPATLVIQGQTVDPAAVVTVQWDSGAGYNSYEQEQFRFLPIRSAPDKPFRIVLAGSGKNQVSRGSSIVLDEIRIDDHGLPIPAKALHQVRNKRGAGWFFKSADSRIALTVPGREQISLLLKTNGRSGILRVSIDGQDSYHDLYRGNWAALHTWLRFWLLDEQGNFALAAPVPRYRVDSLRINAGNSTVLSSLHLKTRTGRLIELPLPEKQADGQFILPDPNQSLKHYFYPGRFLQQLIFALLMSWLSCALWQLIRRYGGLRLFFVGRELRMFWMFFSGAAVVYSGYLLLFWPGIMSVDSLNIWRAAWLPDVMINDHPALNILWYTFLLHLWNNVAVVPVSHILLLSLLIGMVFNFCHRQGVRLRWLLPCYFLLLGSLPIGLYNLNLWKDIPFALLVVFWGLVPGWFFLRRQEGRLQLTVSQGAGLLLLFLALILIRHNGLVYLFALPILFLVLRLVRVSRKMLITGGIGIVCLTLLVLFPPKSMKSASYFHDLSQTYLQQLLADSPGSRIRQSTLRYTRLLDLKKNKQESDLWHYYLGDRYAHTFLRQAGWNDAHPYYSPTEALFPGLRAKAMQLYWKSMEYPWVYCSWNPFWLLYLFPLSIVLCRWLPLSAIFSSVILVQVSALLLFVDTVNWRYYYFVLLGGYFLLPVILLDLHRLRLSNQMES